MTAPLHHPLVADGRGHRSAQTLLLIERRNALLREAVARFYSGLSQREAARQLRIRLMLYRDGRWRRDRSEAECPSQHRDKMAALLYALLRTRDHVPSERTIRAAMAQFRNSASEV